MNSMGDLVDKLSIINLKLWFVQDLVHKAADKGEGISAETATNLVSLNMERNRLMSEIDSAMATAVKDGHVHTPPRIKLK